MDTNGLMTNSVPSSQSETGYVKNVRTDLISIYDVAKYIFDNWHKSYITQIELYKLLWFCQGWHFNVTNEPLFKEDFEAWVNGPVSPELWKIFKGRVRLFSEDFDGISGNAGKVMKDNNARMVVDKILLAYGRLSQAKLIYLTHQCIPWQNHVDESDQIIPQDEIREYFCSL